MCLHPPAPCPCIQIKTACQCKPYARNNCNTGIEDFQIVAIFH